VPKDAKKTRKPHRSNEHLILLELKAHSRKLDRAIELLEKIWKEERPHVGD